LLNNSTVETQDFAKKQHDPGYVFAADELFYFDGRNVIKVDTINFEDLKNLKKELDITDCIQPTRKLSCVELQHITSLTGQTPNRYPHVQTITKIVEEEIERVRAMLAQKTPSQSEDRAEVTSFTI
jgi:hypothetical protein